MVALFKSCQQREKKNGKTFHAALLARSEAIHESARLPDVSARMFAIRVDSHPKQRGVSELVSGQPAVMRVG
jgi:hypothetical protein